MDCPIYGILSYNGSPKDIIINYTLLALNLIIATYPLIVLTEIHGVSNNNIIWKRRLCAFCSFIFVSVFQISLCLLIHCSGISIIWCALAGWIWMDYYHQRKHESRQEQQLNYYSSNYCKIHVHQIIVLLVDFIAIMYYLIVMEPITTLAHILPFVVLGLPSYFLTERVSGMDRMRHDTNSYEPIS